jgi:hypothetical protein
MGPSAILALLLHAIVSIAGAATFDIATLSGRWFQVFASATPSESYQQNSFCITADWTHFESNPIDSVLTFHVQHSQR